MLVRRCSTPWSTATGSPSRWRININCSQLFSLQPLPHWKPRESWMARIITDVRTMIFLGGNSYLCNVNNVWQSINICIIKKLISESKTSIDVFHCYISNRLWRFTVYMGVFDTVPVALCFCADQNTQVKILTQKHHHAANTYTPLCQRNISHNIQNVNLQDNS